METAEICKNLQNRNYKAEAYFPYEPILPCSDLRVLNHTIHHSEHCFNRVHFYYVVFSWILPINVSSNILGQFSPNILPHFCG